MTDNMKTGPKRRGRPPGSGVDDAATLAVIADLLAAEPGLKPTSAIKRTVRKVGASQLRRLQVKWKKNGATLLEGAQQRGKHRLAAQEESRRRPSAGWASQSAVAAALGASLQHASAIASPLMMEQARMAGCFGSQHLAALSAVDHLIPPVAVSATLKAISEAALSPALQAAMAEPAWMKSIRQITEQEERLRQLCNPLGHFGS